jgi:hypothetical protein
MASTINGTSTGNGGLISTGDDSGILNIQTNETTAITVDASQNVGIGTTSPATRFDVRCASDVTQDIAYFSRPDAAVRCKISLDGSGIINFGTSTSHPLAFLTGNTERMRIDSSGQLGIGVSPYAPLTVAYAKASDVCIDFRNTSGTTPYGMRMALTGATPNNNSQYFITTSDATATRAVIYTNGGLANYSANNVNLSDQREKKNIELAGSYLTKVCAIPVKTFLYNDQTDTDLNLGAIAQDVQAVAPELVMESNWGSKEEPKMRLSIYQTDLQYALMKSIQELKAMVDSIQSEFDAYKATHP